MYPFASLPENLAAFCRGLNRDHAFQIGPRELADAARALAITPLGDETAVRHALRPVLCTSRAQADLFDPAFSAFFHPPGPSQEAAAAERAWESTATERRPRRSSGHTGSDEAAAGDITTGAGMDATESSAEDADAAAVQLSRASAVEGSTDPPALEPVDDAWREAARVFVRSLKSGQGRRWRAAARGPRFDLRRTLRCNLHTGGEMLLTRWRARAPRRLSIVVLVDASRSMSPHVGSALRIAVALSSAPTHVETFVFSTALQRVTREVRAAAAGTTETLPALGYAWGGGTSIGRCLDLFARVAGEHASASQTLVFIVSDGLDTGSPDLLRDAVARLHRQTSGVIWLNPLLPTAGYQPIAQGMRAARPYLTGLTWVAAPLQLRKLAARTRFRR